MQIPFSNLWKGAGVMGDKMLQYRGLTFAAWGYFFLNFGFSIDGIQLLPEFVGYLLLLFAIGALFKECRNLLYTWHCTCSGQYLKLGFGVSFAGTWRAYYDSGYSGSCGKIIFSFPVFDRYCRPGKNLSKAGRSTLHPP